MVQVLITHATSQRNRLSIRMRGLLPRRTRDYNYPSYGEQPKGVFGRWFGDQAWWGAVDGTRDVYLVDIAGMPTTADQVLTDAIVVTERIPPERIVARLEDVPQYAPKVYCVTFAKAKSDRLRIFRKPGTLQVNLDIDFPTFLMDDTKEY